MIVIWDKMRILTPYSYLGNIRDDKMRDLFLECLSDDKKLNVIVYAHTFENHPTITTHPADSENPAGETPDDWMIDQKP